MSIVSVIAVVILSGVAFGLQPKDKNLRYWYWVGLCFKMLMGVAVGLVYTYYYPSGDTFSFFQDSIRASSLARADISGYLDFLWKSDFPTSLNPLLAHDARSLFFIKWISVFNLISQDNYWITGLFFSLISFLGAWRVFTIVKQVNADATVAAGFSLLLFPSFVFWTSGIMKESLAMACLLFVTSHIIKVCTNKSGNILEWLAAMLSIWIAWKLKYYFVAVFIPIVFALLATHLFNKHRDHTRKWVTIGFSVSIFLLVVAGVSFLHPNFHFSYLLEVMVSNNNEYVRLSNPENSIHYYQLSAQPLQLLINAPWALISGLFRPFICEAQTPVQLAAAIENSVLLILFVACFIRQRFTVKLWTLALVMYVVVLCIFLAIAVPNMGTLSRYRVGFLPFFVFIITYRNPLIARIVKIHQKIK